MFSDKWRARIRVGGKYFLYAAIVTYLLVLLYDIDSMRSDISSLQLDVMSVQDDVSSTQSDVSHIEDGTCTNDHLCR